MFNETNIFELLNDKYVLPKKVKLFESFAGIGCQRMAFNRLGIEVEMIGISEIDRYAIQSYNAIHGDTKNWGSICDIKGQDLPQIDVFTYSFPCTDLSKAGKQAGLNSIRSGLVYEVLRILHELKQVDRLPKCLIMENVVDLVQVKFIRQFQEIQLELEQLGYSNYAQTLNAKNYGIAQNRDRIFMVSVLGEKYYEFPKPIKLEKRLKDYLENYVDEKYYLSEDQIESYRNSAYACMQRENDVNGICQTLDTMQGGNREPKIIEPLTMESLDKKFTDAILTKEEYLDITGISIRIPEDTKKGYSEAYDGDGVYINRPEQKRGVFQNQMIQKLKTGCADVGVIDNKDGLRIRKLTPKECWRLMGINDDEFNKASKVV